MKKVFCLFWGLAILALFSCAKPSSSEDNTDDIIGPNAITDLAVVNVTTNSITLQWTAPGDDDTVGYAQEYDLRVSYDSITADNFSQTFRITGDLGPLPSRMTQQDVVDNLQPDSIYYFALKSRDDADNWSAISNCARGQCAAIHIVSMPDTALQRIIREHINKPNGDIYSNEVDTITQVDAPGMQIASIEGLQYFTSLQILMVPSNNISDISPIANLQQLGQVDITFNIIGNIQPLEGHEGIFLLHIGANPISDISPLSTITALRQLWLYDTDVTDFSPLYDLPHLTDIHFGSCNLSDIGFMAYLTHVRIAQLSDNHFTSISPLAADTALMSIGLDGSTINDLTPLADLHNLNDISLRNNNVSDIQPLVDNEGIASGDIVRLNSNPLSQVSIDSLIPLLEARGVTVLR
jgi:Leucine-rich repeat (LRR) protein